MQKLPPSAASFPLCMSHLRSKHVSTQRLRSEISMDFSAAAPVGLGSQWPPLSRSGHRRHGPPGAAKSECQGLKPSGTSLDAPQVRSGLRFRLGEEDCFLWNGERSWVDGSLGVQGYFWYGMFVPGPSNRCFKDAFRYTKTTRKHPHNRFEPTLQMCKKYLGKTTKNPLQSSLLEQNTSKKQQHHITTPTKLRPFQASMTQAICCGTTTTPTWKRGAWMPARFSGDEPIPVKAPKERRRRPPAPFQAPGSAKRHRGRMV